MMSQSVNASKPRKPGPVDLSRYAGNREPNLSDLYNDPILHAILRCDGLPLTTLKDIISTAQRRMVAQ